MEDTGQDGVLSPATPGPAKSKLDTLPKEELIKFAKKQMVMIQKLKTKCTDLEKEIEGLKSKPTTEGVDDVVQALTDRLDSVLLEKAETQQQLVKLKKEYAKIKVESEDAARKASELQSNYEQSSSCLSEKIEKMQDEINQNQTKHKEEVEALKRELKEAYYKLELQGNQEGEIKKLQVDVEQMRSSYEEQISNLQRGLDAVIEEKNQEIGNLNNSQLLVHEQHQHEIRNLNEELHKLRNVHQDKVLDLKSQLESSAIEYVKQKESMQELLNQYREKENMLLEEMETNNKKHALEVKHLKEKLEEKSMVPEAQVVVPEVIDDKVLILENLLTDLESQQSIVQEELTYTNNVKEKLEIELKNIKSEYFHEREELEFKINELQLAIEDYNGLIEKLKCELRIAKEDFEKSEKQNSVDIQAMKEQHIKEITDLKQSITSQFENEKYSFDHEIQLLKEQNDRLHKEKSEAVRSYENLRETLVSLQEELGDSAGKISREFEAMKQQQAIDVHELQQKLRVAYKDKNDLLETVNRLKAEVDLLSGKQAECEELQLQITTLHHKNEEVVASLHRQDEMLKDMEIKMGQTTIQNEEVFSTIKSSTEQICKLQEICNNEKSRALSLQKETEEQANLIAELTQKIDKLTEKLSGSENFSAELKLQLESLLLERESNASYDEMLNLKEEKEMLSKDFERLMAEHSSCLMLQENIKNMNDLQEKLTNAYNEKNVLLETVNNLQEEAKVLLSRQTECEELQLQIENLQEKNEEVMTLLHQKCELLKEMEEKLGQAKMQNSDVSCAYQSSGEEINKLQDMCKSEQDKNSCLQKEFDDQEQLIANLKQNIEELTEKLQDSIKRNDYAGNERDNLQQQVESLQMCKKDLETECQKCQNEVLNVSKEKDVLRRDFDRLLSEHSECFSLRQELEELRMKFQLVAEDKEQVTKFLESEQHQIEAVKCQLIVLRETLSIDDAEQDIIHMLQSINEAMSQINEEKQNMILQRDEKSVELERLQEKSESQSAELRAILNDYSTEKVLLKEQLDETIRDKETLLNDLVEMKNALEKLKLQNQDLVTDLEKLTADLETVKKEKAEMLVQLNQEGQMDLQSLIESKESNMNALTLELTSVKDSLSKSKALEFEQQAHISELETKIANLEKHSKQTEEKCNKIKAVAVKAKKELDSCKKENQSIKAELEKNRSERDQFTSSMKDLVQSAEGYQNLLREYDRQVELLEVEKERSKNVEHQLAELAKQIQASTLEKEKLSLANEDLVAHMETMQTNNKLYESQILELQKAKFAVDKELEAEKLVKEQKIKDHSLSLSQVQDLQNQLQKEKKQLQKTAQELELVRRDAQKSTLMDMEIADYERLVKDLNQKISIKSSQLEDLEQELQIQKQKQEMLQEEISSLQATVEQHEERSTKMKQLLVRTKKELADAKHAESDQLILQASLKGELEASLQQVEAFKIQVAELTSDKHKVQEQLRALAEQQQRAAGTYQQKLSTLQEECAAAKAEQVSVTSEFESYKVRVHNVLKQQKNKSTSQAEHEVYKQEKEHLQSMVDQLKAKLQETQHNLQINAIELQSLQSEHDTLLERHNKLLQETVTKEAELREKLCSVQSEYTVLKTDHSQVVSQLSAQNEALQNSFSDQVRRLQDDQRKTVETLQQQLSKVEAQLFQMKSESNVASSHQPLKGLRERRPVDLPLLDMYSVAREEGEGMETTDTESVSSASTHIASFEQLLSSAEAKNDPPQWHPELSKEELTQKLNTTSKSVDHMSGLLRETEATNAMLMEQITLLKNEVRRLERNQEREKSVANLEYLKNVLLQFIFLKAGSERQRLLPVIDTMLQLSPDEKGKLHAIAHGEEDAGSRPAGWSSYLHSWSGLR
ncbi:hypothetical protein XENTR_v10006261 [Xenopus tropicalis]|uniref:GRIP and coiled-coil domain-containing 2 n=1 Tax=Xenopus tropicalis TaxID=8364 RepID=A0A6I8SRG4_XENTR|nr:GRIP and coiled-coil domain-containing protein 2 [Xenopus tropicalis]KAE8625410.1 hypothetical protein XENTR_v10006261 [Xenopus tropicalis]